MLQKLLTYSLLDARVRSRNVRLGAICFFYLFMMCTTIVFVAAQQKSSRTNDRNYENNAYAGSTRSSTKKERKSFQSISFNSTRVLVSGEENTCVPVTRGRADWINKPLPDICAKIMNFPQPFKKNCSGEQVPGTPKCDPDHPMMFAQYGEDYFLYTRHFVHMKKPGFYLDIAANQ